MSRMESFAAGLATCLLLAGAAAAQDLAEVPRERTLVTIGWSAGSPTLSAPNNANWYSLGAELRNGIMFVNEPLFTYNHFTGEHIPWIAESYEYNDDYTSLTVKLRDGVTWSDGEPFSAKATVALVNQPLEEVESNARRAFERERKQPHFAGDLDLDAEISVIHGDQRITSSADRSLEQVGQEFGQWIQSLA